jgi:hypothetical protein
MRNGETTGKAKAKWGGEESLKKKPPTGKSKKEKRGPESNDTIEANRVSAGLLHGAARCSSAKISKAGDGTRLGLGRSTGTGMGTGTGTGYGYNLGMGGGLTPRGRGKMKWKA